MAQQSNLTDGHDQTTAVVTGASSGIGRAIAVALARAGVARMLVHYRRNRQGAEQTAGMLQEVGCQSWTVAADIASADDQQRLVETAFERLGEVQTWVNNAGADVLTGDEASLDFASKLRLLLDVDVRGTILLSRLVAARLVAQGSSLPPSILFLGWDQAPHGMEGDAGQMFAPVKAAVMAYSASLAQSLAPKVRVNALAPGWIRTSWGDSASDYWNRRAEHQALMHRWGTPDDVAKAAVYLADPSNSFITGQTLEVNGGWNRRLM